MNKKKIKAIENFLNQRFEIALHTDNEMGNEKGAKMLPNNPDFIYYSGMLDALLCIGFDYTREKIDGKIHHTLYYNK